jgi:pyridoxamine--pyruvate transaminase
MYPADFTLSAGPTTVSAEVLAAMGRPIIYHYDPSFVETFRRTVEKAARIFGTKEDVILMQGEAVVGLEAAGRACVRPGMKVVNLVSGVFGKGMSDWLNMWGANVVDITVPYNDAVSPEVVQKALKENPDVELVAMVHSETPSGTLNPVEEIGPMVRAHGAVSLVDCVSSLAGMPFHPDEWQLDICVAGAQKCLSGPPGITLMTVSKEAWALIDKNPSAPRWSFVALLDWREIYIKGGRFPFTPSVSDVFGLEACLDWVMDQGLDNAIAQHTIAAEACRTGVKAMGLKLWPKNEAIMSTCTTAIAVPEGLNDVQVRSHVRERYGVQISSGQNAGNLIRIGHMGVTARSLYPVIGISALGRSLADLGVKVDIGAGVEAALEVLSRAQA